MKNSLYRLSLLLVLVSLASPVLAASEPARAAPDRGFIAFLDSLQKNPVPLSAAAKAKGPGGGVSEMALCTASANCGSDPGVYCEDHTSPANCSGVDQNCGWGQRGWVSCNGVTTYCPDDCDPCPEGWCDGADQCAWSCYPCPYNYNCMQQYCADDCQCRYDICSP